MLKISKRTQAVKELTYHQALEKGLLKQMPRPSLEEAQEIEQSIIPKKV